MVPNLRVAALRCEPQLSPFPGARQPSDPASPLASGFLTTVTTGIRHIGAHMATLPIGEHIGGLATLAIDHIIGAPTVMASMATAHIGDIGMATAHTGDIAGTAGMATAHTGAIAGTAGMVTAH